MVPMVVCVSAIVAAGSSLLAMPHVFPSNVGKLVSANQALDVLSLFLREKFGSCMDKL